MSMPTQSPQRRRQPPVNQQIPGAMQHLQPRETSRSPSIRDRPRAMKTQSMPLVPQQIYPQQSPPTAATQPSRRSPQQVTRLLPTPPHPNPPTHIDLAPDHRISPPLPPQHSLSQPNINTHYPRPINRMPPQFLNKYQNMDDSWQMTEELLADIERADQQQSQTQYPINYASRVESPAPIKDPSMERVKATERSSPKDADTAQQQQQRRARESPKTRDRQPASSPTVASFVQAQSLTPERRMSPAYHPPMTSPEQQQQNYTPYATRESPPVHRQPRSQQLSSMASQTPPLQTIPARTPDRSLPVQEEPEDEISGVSTKNARDTWKTEPQPLVEQQQRPLVEQQQQQRRSSSSPTPSSDLIHPDSRGYSDNTHGGRDNTHGGRDSRAGHRDDKSVSSSAQNDADNRRYIEREHGEDEGGYTPRSPTAGLPEDQYYNQTRGPIRLRTRNGSTDQLGLRSLDPAVFEPSPSSTSPATLITPSDRPTKYLDPRRQSQDDPIKYKHQLNQQLNQQLNHQQRYDPRDQQQQYYPPQVYPDDFPSYNDDSASAYIQAYLQSPRPEAPVPPTPHSQTAAPSPSPLVSGGYGGNSKDLPPFSPVAPVGSPYPYPFNHVRRNHPVMMHPNRPQFQLPPTITSRSSSTNNNNHNNNNNNNTTTSPYDPNHPSAIQEQLAKQWQMYAMNALDNVTDSTFSPSATPFQGGLNPWASWHTNRTLRRTQGMLGHNNRESTSLHSSPSHEPVPLPHAPSIGLKKKDRGGGAGAGGDRVGALRRGSDGALGGVGVASHRKPPPRVESTQPRETSPEPSSSGEETAGEEHYSSRGEGHYPLPMGEGHYPPTRELPWSLVNGAGVGIGGVVQTVMDDDNSDWIDEDSEGDEEDLLQLEYHPNFINNVDKRRRRWEVGIEAVTQAFQSLDRQTDATMILLAAPSHSTKLHMIKSRCIRREPSLSLSHPMSELRTHFRRIAAQRRTTRSHKSSLIDRFLIPSTVDDSDGSGSSERSREEDLRRALDAALGSLGALGGIYEQREARWADEMRRIMEDRERVELLLRQVLGENHPLAALPTKT